MIDVEIVKENIPSLISKSSLKKAGMILNMQLDKAVMFDQDIQLHLSTNGHYAVEILSKSLMNSTECENMVMFDINTNQQSKIKCMDKIHKQSGHALAGNLKRLFKNAGKLNSEITSLIDATVEKCKKCNVYKKPNPRPIVGLSIATDFNPDSGHGFTLTL